MSNTNTPDMRAYIDILNEQPYSENAMGEDPVKVAQDNLTNAKEAVAAAAAGLKAAQDRVTAAQAAVQAERAAAQIAKQRGTPAPNAAGTPAPNAAGTTASPTMPTMPQ